jgi:hypothetical protein
MRIVRAMVSSLLILALIVIAASVYARRHGDPVPRADDAESAGRAVPAAILSQPTLVPTSPPLPTLPVPVPTLPPNIPPPPTPRATDPDLTNAVPLQGVPAIRPSRPLANPNEPAFTEDDVRAYVTKRGGALGRRIRTDGPYQIDNILFLRSAEAPTRLGIRTGLEDDQLLCAATLRGTFIVTGPPSTEGREYIKSRLILLFDARTGNLLGQDALP